MSFLGLETLSHKNHYKQLLSMFTTYSENTDYNNSALWEGGGGEVLGCWEYNFRINRVIIRSAFATLSAQGRRQ